MMKNKIKTLLVASGIAMCCNLYAQEQVTAITPLKITSGLNADVIAEAKADDNTTEYQEMGNVWNSYKFYSSTLATNVDGDDEGGRNAFYTTGVQEEGAIKYKTENGYTYLDGNTDDIPYYMEAPTANNALLIKDNQEYTISLSKLDGGSLPAANALYLLATSAEGKSSVTVDIIGEDGAIIGTTSVTVGDWWSSDASEKLTQVYETQRITVKGLKPSNSWNGTGENYINYVNKGENNNGTFYLQRIAVSTLSTQPVKEIRIQKTSSKGHLVILAATAATEEVTELDKQSTLDYLVNTTTKQRIAETVKYRVNLHRDFKAGVWQPLVFNCELTAKQAKAMFGQNIQLSVITDNSYVGNRIIFYPVTLSDEDKVVIKRGNYYLIKDVTLADADATTGLQKYTCDYVQFRACEDYNSGLVTTKTIYNSDGDAATFHGTYVSGKQIGEGSYAMSGGQFYKYTDNPTIGAFRFWFTITEAGGSSKEITYEIGDTEVTAIKTIGADKAESARPCVYSIDGRVVRQGTTSTDGLAKGLYIVNNKKVMIK